MLNLYLMLILANADQYLNLTDWIIENYGTGTFDLLMPLFDAIFDVLEILIPVPGMWTDIWERLFC